MSFLRRLSSRVRTWLGLGDPSDDHLIPTHGWLRGAPEVALGEADGPVYLGPRLP